MILMYWSFGAHFVGIIIHTELKQSINISCHNGKVYFPFYEYNVMWIHKFNQLNLTEKHYEMLCLVSLEILNCFKSYLTYWS
jgi:hypothetical protein